jgi:ATP-dependent DNA helicase PIF1
MIKKFIFAYSDLHRVDDIYTPKFLNTISCSGLSNHKLRLYVGVPVMLLKNLDKKLGLCN